MMNGLAFGGAAVLSSSLDMRIGCEDTKFRFLAAAYGRINSTWTLPNQVGWPIAKELLFTARVVEAEEAYRIGLLNHLVPREQLRAKTMELAKTIAGTRARRLTELARRTRRMRTALILLRRLAHLPTEVGALAGAHHPAARVEAIGERDLARVRGTITRGRRRGVRRPRRVHVHARAHLRGRGERTLLRARRRTRRGRIACGNVGGACTGRALHARCRR